MPDEMRLLYWVVTSAIDPFKRRKSTWRMTEEDARERYCDARVADFFAAGRMRTAGWGSIFSAALSHARRDRYEM